MMNLPVFVAHFLTRCPIGVEYSQGFEESFVSDLAILSAIVVLVALRLFRNLRKYSGLSAAIELELGSRFGGD